MLRKVWEIKQYQQAAQDEYEHELNITGPSICFAPEFAFVQSVHYRRDLLPNLSVLHIFLHLRPWKCKVTRRTRGEICLAELALYKMTYEQKSMQFDAGEE